MKRCVFIFLLSGSFLTVQAQILSFQPKTDIPMSSEGQVLENPWAGGLNAPQFSTMDLNRDQVDDLVVFDRTASKITTFLAVNRAGKWAYQHAPSYEFLFPKIDGWLLLRDYDGDGHKDLFAHTGLGIKVYRNSPQENYLRWELTADPIRTQGFNGLINLQVNIIDIPAIVDLDEDGDLDIITFDFIQGNMLEYHQNMSVENHGEPGHLSYKRLTKCWGGIFEGQTCGDFSFGITCGSGRGAGGGGSSETARTLHVGSTITVLDLNGDQMKDILVGDVSCQEIFQMLNQGSNVEAKFTSFSTDFPQSQAINFPIFPAVFWEDVNFDGRKDLIASPNVFSNEGNQVDFARSAWLYQNESDSPTPNFQFQREDFLQNTMLDWGEDVFPAAADYDADGDQDLVIGYRGQRQGDEFWATLILLENVGNAQNPSFVVQDADYLQVSSQKLSDLKPFFQDLNGDQRLDLAFVGTSEGQTQLYWFENQADSQQALVYNQTDLQMYALPLPMGSFPLLYDIDQDGDFDLFTGGRLGNLSYYRNEGTSSEPNFQLISDTLGGLEKNSLRRNLCPRIVDLNQDGQLDLLTGDGSGRIRFYSDFLSRLEETWLPEEDFFYSELENQPRSYHFGLNTYPLCVDWNQDGGLDLMVGTHGGGLSLWENRSQITSLEEQFDFTSQVKIFPNPTEQVIYIKSPRPLEIEVYTKDGKKLLIEDFVPPHQKFSIEMHTYPSGTYLFKLRTADGQQSVQKVILRP